MKITHISIISKFYKRDVHLENKYYSGIKNIFDTENWLTCDDKEYVIWKTVQGYYKTKEKIPWYQVIL